MFRLILLCDYTREPERRLLRGLSDFARSKGGWRYFQMPVSIYKNAARRQEVFDKARAINADAIFGRWEGVDMELAAPLGIPVVLRTVQRMYPDFPMLSGDYKEIGRMAASFFLRQHYETYAFIGYEGLIWSDERLEGFGECLEEKGFAPHCFKTDLAEPDGEAIKEWLTALPKPVALLSANDVLAAQVAELCLEAGINIPAELALLGVDNDEFLCNIAGPGISSIHLDFERQGRELGEAIYKMHTDGEMRPVRIMVHPLSIIERGSTLRHNIKDPYILNIVEFIDANFLSSISIEDIVRDIPLSRRAIELRFKKEMAPHTILSYLTSLRINRMCHLLAATDLPVSIAAEKSGFDDVLNVGRTFKRYTGMSPALYRKKNQKLSYAPDHEYSGHKQG